MNIDEVVKKNFEFIKENVEKEWAIQLLMLEVEFDDRDDDSQLHIFHSLEQILEWADIPFLVSINPNTCAAYLPCDAQTILYELNELLRRTTGRSIAALACHSCTGLTYHPADMIVEGYEGDFIERIKSGIDECLLALRKSRPSEEEFNAYLDDINKFGIDNLTESAKQRMKIFSRYLQNKKQR